MKQKNAVYPRFAFPKSSNVSVFLYNVYPPVGFRYLTCFALLFYRSTSVFVLRLDWRVKRYKIIAIIKLPLIKLSILKIKGVVNEIGFLRRRRRAFLEKFNFLFRGRTPARSHVNI